MCQLTLDTNVEIFLWKTTTEGFFYLFCLKFDQLATLNLSENYLFQIHVKFMSNASFKLMLFINYCIKFIKVHMDFVI